MRVFSNKGICTTH